MPRGRKPDPNKSPSPQQTLAQNKIRRRQIDEKLIETFCRHIAEGNYIETAAALAGVSSRAVNSWVQEARGERVANGKVMEPRPIVLEFVRRYEEALAQSEAAVVAKIREAMAESRNWTAAAWYLERKFPDRWGKIDRQKVEVTGKDGEPLHGVLAVPVKVSAEDWIAMASGRSSSEEH